MEDKLFMSTDHQLQGYSKGTPNVTTTSARDTQTLAGQPGQGHTVPCRPVLTTTFFNMKAYYTHAFLVKDPTLTIHLVRVLTQASASTTSSARDTQSLRRPVLPLPGQDTQSYTDQCIYP